MERHVADAEGLRLGEICRGLRNHRWRLSVGAPAMRGDVALEQGQEPFTVRRIAGFDHQVEDKAASAGCQVELVTVLNVTTAFDDDVGVRLEQAEDLFGGGDRFA